LDLGDPAGAMFAPHARIMRAEQRAARDRFDHLGNALDSVAFEHRGNGLASAVRGFDDNAIGAIGGIGHASPPRTALLMTPWGADQQRPGANIFASDRGRTQGISPSRPLAKLSPGGRTLGSQSHSRARTFPAGRARFALLAA